MFRQCAERMCGTAKRQPQLSIVADGTSEIMSWLLVCRNALAGPCFVHAGHVSNALTKQLASMSWFRGSSLYTDGIVKPCHLPILLFWLVTLHAALAYGGGIRTGLYTCVQAQPSSSAKRAVATGRSCGCERSCTPVYAGSFSSTIS